MITDKQIENMVDLSDLFNDAYEQEREFNEDYMFSNPEA